MGAEHVKLAPANHFLIQQRVLSQHIEQEKLMAKGQQKSNKEAKKPKKDSSPPKPMTGEPVMPTRVTVVPDRSKKAK